MNYSNEDIMEKLKRQDMEIDYLSAKYKQIYSRMVSKEEKHANQLLEVAKKFEHTYRMVVNEIFTSLDETLETQPQLRMEIRGIRAKIVKKMDQIKRTLNEHRK